MRGIHFGEFLQEYLLRVIALGTEIVEDPDFFDAKVNVVVLVLAEHSAVVDLVELLDV